MQHEIIEQRRAKDQHGARVRLAWLALAALGLTAACSGDTTGATATGDAGPGASTGSGTGAGTGGGLTPQCTISSPDLLVSDAAGSSPAIAFGGDHYLLAWTSTAKDAGDIRTALFDAKGTKVSEQALAEGPAVAAYPSVAAEPGGGYLVVWQEASLLGNGVQARHLDAQGMPLGVQFQLGQSSSTESRPSAAATATSVAVVWSDNIGATLGLVTGDALTEKQTIVQAQLPSLGAAGPNLGLTWASGSRMAAAMLASPTAMPTPVLFRTAMGKANLPRVAVHDDGTLSVVWEDNRGGDGNESVYLTRIDKSNQASQERLVSMSSASANYPDVAWTGSHDAVVYYQFRDGPPAVYLSLIDRNLATSGKDLKVSGEGLSARYPRIARTGDTLGTLGVVYAEKDGPIRMSLVACP